MQGTISPDVARAAIALRHSHPHVPPREILDVVMRKRSGRLADFGALIEPGTDFAVIVAEVFDPGMAPEDWRTFFKSPNADPVLVAMLRTVWTNEVLPVFAAAYGLST